MAGNLPFHPAPGLGDLIPGYFVVPRNPITAQARAPITVSPGIGDIIRASFPVPQNPIISAVTGNVKPLGTGDCGCGGKCGGCGGSGRGMINGQRVGMGDLSTDVSAVGSALSGGNFSAALQDTIGGIPVWGLIAAAIAIPWFMNQRSGGRRR